MSSTRIRPGAIIIATLLLAFLGCPKEPAGQQSNLKEITYFGFSALVNEGMVADIGGEIIGTAITVELPDGLARDSLVASFNTTGVGVSVNGTPQESSITPNDFSSPLTYTVTAENGTTKDYTVTITFSSDPKSGDNSISSFAFPASLNGGSGLAADATGTISTSSIAVTVPAGVKTDSLIASFTIAATASISINGTAQISGVTQNDFSSPLTYTVTAENSTTKDYTVTITFSSDPKSGDNSISSFAFPASLNGGSGLAADATGTISTSSIAVTVPAGVKTDSLIASFTIAATASISINGTAQISGVTQNDFSSPLTYTVTAENGTTKDYTVTITELDTSSWGEELSGAKKPGIALWRLDQMTADAKVNIEWSVYYVTGYEIYKYGVLLNDELLHESSQFSSTPTSDNIGTDYNNSGAVYELPLTEGTNKIEVVLFVKKDGGNYYVKSDSVSKLVAAIYQPGEVRDAIPGEWGYTDTITPEDLTTIENNIKALISQNAFEAMFPYRIGTDNWLNFDGGRNKTYEGRYAKPTYGDLIAGVKGLANIKLKIYKKAAYEDAQMMIRLDKTTGKETVVLVGVDYYKNTSQPTIQIVDFADFLAVGTTSDRKRELAAFFANTSHETTGGGSQSLLPYQFGYFFVEETGFMDSDAIGYVQENNPNFPAVPGKSYHGRGLIQTSYNSNYGMASVMVYNDKNILLANPEKIVQDASLLFQTAIIFWMIPRDNKPSCHEVMQSSWIGSDDKPQGFGTTVNIINGGLEAPGHTEEFGIENGVLSEAIKRIEIFEPGKTDPTLVYSEQYSSQNTLNLKITIIAGGIRIDGTEINKTITGDREIWIRKLNGPTGLSCQTLIIKIADGKVSISDIADTHDVTPTTTKTFKVEDHRVLDRLTFYHRYAKYLGVDMGANLGTKNATSFTQ